MILLNAGQEAGVQKAVNWWLTQYKQVFSITGKAGTGKSTMLNALIDRLGLEMHEVLFVTYIGQASLVLQMKGLNSATIHSTIYELVETFKRDDKGQIMYVYGRPIVELKFQKKPIIPAQIRLIVVDEAGMVPNDIGIDLESFNVPIVAVGDRNQLPPIFGISRYLENPDVILDELMRHEEDSPIVHLASMALDRQHIPYGKYGNCYVISPDEVTDNMLKFSSAILCGKNATRDSLNHHIRENIFGFTGDLPQKGDKLICRKNNWQLKIGDIALVNGLSGYVHSHIDLSQYNHNNKSFKMDFRPTFLDNKWFSDVLVDHNFLLSGCGKDNKIQNNFDNSNKFEYGYAITTHLSQGSQYPSVLIFEEMLNYSTHHNWLYTAITRAVNMVIIVKKPRG